MTPIIDKYIGQDVLEQAVSQNNYNEECIKEFIRYVDYFLTELEQDNAIEEDRTGADLLTVPLEYTNYYAKIRNEGFSIAWSKKYADYKTSGETRNLLMHCYEATEEQDKQQADADLMTYFTVTKRDQIFIDYFLKRISIGDRFGERSVEKDVEEFVLNYNEQIRKGKSKLYAYQYADWLIDGYHPIFCEDYAYIYEESINKGKSEEYAHEYAEQYASELVNIKRRYGISDDEESLNYAKAKAKAHINGWEYAHDNVLKSYGKFMECYKHAYLNILYSDDPYKWKTIELCEKIALDKALNEYERITKKE
jgi:hypothetical protein